MFKRSMAALVGSVLACAAFTTPATAGKSDDTLTWATSTEIDTFDIYYQGLREVVIATMFNCDSLFHRDPASGEYKPLLAASYRWVDDVTLEVELRKGIKFHDGTELDAEDVVSTFRHVMPADSGINVRLAIDWIKAVEAVDPHKVRFIAKAPTPAALEFLSGNTAIYPSGHYDKAPVVSAAGGKTRRDWGAVRPVCTGPYIMKDFKAGQSATFVKNPDYFKESPKGQPKIGKIVYRTIADNEAQLAELLAGTVDWIWGVPPENVPQLSSMGVTVKTAPTTRMSFLLFDAAGRSGDTPLKDVRVRQAIFHAIDREAIAKLVGNSAEVLKSMCYPTQVGCTADVTQHAYDPAKAKALLAEAGYAKGLKLPFYAYRDKSYSEAVLAYLRAVGIEPDFRFIQNVALRPLIIGGKAELAHLTWGSQGMQDASASVSLYFKFGADDYARDAEVKDLLDKADTTMDPAQRRALYAKALERINAQAYAVPLFAYGRAYAYTKDLDYPVTPDELAHFYLARWK
jgi:peptide/nickel transport system substrate-binding protein